ncbi:translocation protein S66 [Apophysomyces ossiformis]|uniref:Translocation protein S66 n=1 Tax=Apophysomyces ossiformis TaxID=679940 RepID=A0A8H7BZD6_9FUNG|nr:translocation protein S66 [Apophysomyces ossiformis]
MNSLLLPALYLGGCIAAMSVFSFVYRRATGFKPVDPWFPENVEKEQYIALLNCETPVPEHHLRAALLRRAMEAVRRLVQVQQEKPALQQLQRTGSIGDDLWRDFTVAEQEILMELQEISQEANTYKEGWGQTIFSLAAQMLEHEKQKQLQTEMKNLREVEEKKRLIAEKRQQKEAQEAEERRLKEAKKAEEELLRMEEEEKKKQKGKGKK